MIGHGDAFIMRDPSGIRPLYYYYDDEIVVAASERPAIQTAFDLNYQKINELRRGHALIVKKDGRISEDPFIAEAPRRSCSFERIYFSRGTDRDIYLERKKLGSILSESVLEAIDYDLAHSVFSFVPNTAETAFLGLIEGVNSHLDDIKIKRLQSGEKLEGDDLAAMIYMKPRVEKLVDKDAKLRTFIADEVVRGDMIAHVYDVTYGIVNDHVDTIVLMDDSIVRGATLRDSIISICLKLNPHKIIIVSSAPQIRYPDCYGIDMSRMGDFIAFQALIALLDENGKNYLIQETYEKCKKELEREDNIYINHVVDLYNEFTYKEISNKIAELITPPNTSIDIEVIYQSIEGLHAACPNNNGDWYFTGNYPTVGGHKVVLRAFINYVEKKNVRAY
jgi:amidophosphoribosyltransferase